MQVSRGFLAVAGFLLSSTPSSGQAVPDAGAPKVTLAVPSGAPLRLYLTKRVSKSLGAPIQAKVLDPVFSFDREVIPAGTIALGSVTRTVPAGKWQRIAAILNGDFTPLRQAEAEFTTLRLPDGRELTTITVASMGLNSFYVEPKANGKKGRSASPGPNGGILGTAKQTAKDRLNGAINARSRGIADIVRAPNRKEKLVDFLWAKLPYHPQYWRSGTRFDAPLRDPLGFGSVEVKPEEMSALGTQPAPDSVAHVRLLTELDSASAKQGDKVEAVLTAPVFSPQHALVLPEGTRLRGEVVVAKKARCFHRPGQLRFSFQGVDLPAEVASLRQAAPARVALTTQGTLQDAEGNGTTPIAVDDEGGVKAKESKTRFIAPVISLMLASRAADNDEGHHTTTAKGPEANVSGRTLGGSLGFGLVGAALSQTSRYVGMAFGYYGLAWSVYSNVIARGGEVQFDKNAMMDIRFGSRTPAPSAAPTAGH
ncbi:MAG TPA: hypothetical protein VNV86_11765 [Candidatus Acidoferrum sp.]|nr:hypothetical protein [Candidatus Acidoferrum sp.]